MVTVVIHLALTPRFTTICDRDVLLDIDSCRKGVKTDYKLQATCLHKTPLHSGLY